VGGAIHDHEHPGVNNVFLVDTLDEIAVRYNDLSVLENHHVASSFKLMKHKEFDIFQDMEQEDFKTLRKKMIGLVLATDMSKHFSEMGKYKPRISASDFDPSQGSDKDSTTHILFHMSDISNSAKPFGVAKKWVDLLFDEFFLQGDLEREAGRNITYLMDRTTVQVARAQIGFLDVIIQPPFECLTRVLPKMQVFLDYVDKTKVTWKLHFEEYDQILEQNK